MRHIFKTKNPPNYNKKNALFFSVMTGIFFISSVAYPASFINRSKQCYGQINPVGPYIGIYGGGAWGSSNFNTDVVGMRTDTSYFSSIDNIISVNQSGSPFLHPNAFIGGIQVGNNWICQNLLYGLTLDFGSFHLSDAHPADNVAYPTYPATYSIQTAVEANWLFTAKGRLGITPNPAWPLIYATGGLALTKLEVSNAFFDTAPSLGKGGASDNHFKTGWTIGGGFEFPLAKTKNLTFNMEYLYVKFGSILTSSSIYNSAGGSPPVGANTSPFSTSADLTANIFRVGLNYKF